jgi:iron complex outermembrane receptor protein
MRKNENVYNKKNIENDSDTNYLYLNIQKEETSIDFGYIYSDIQNHVGFSLDANPDDAKYITNDAFLDFKTMFLDDDSLKLNVSFDVNKLEYEELNQEGLSIVPAIDFTNPSPPKLYKNETQVVKGNTLVSKSFTNDANDLILGLNAQVMNYDLKHKAQPSQLAYNSQEKYGVFIQDSYRALKNLLLISNLKYDSYKRDGGLDDEQNLHFRVGTIFTATKNLGLKAFYTQTNILPSFYNVDFKSQFVDDLKTQKYKYYNIESVYADDNLRFSVLYNNVKIENFIYYTPVGFINVDHIVEVENWIFDLSYDFYDKNTVTLNYFTTKLSEQTNNSNKGGFLKLNGEYENFEYFTSLIYRNAYDYYDTSVDASYNLNLGSTYKFSKDVSLSLKAENILDDSTHSLYKEGLSKDPSVGNFALEDFEPKVTLSTKWVF